MKVDRKSATQRRHQRIRRKLAGTSEQPRLAVYRSNRHIYAQVIDDVNQHTLVAASTLESVLRTSEDGTATIEAASAVGRLVAERAKEKGITSVIFDRGGKLYHGRVKAVAEAAREAGLEF
ncbi:50S ribosomal protein L18 [Gloeobacter kilaueensis]|uniref:Large ribosomal subunit protein uL18 n=1 Tax=Gloeobacter kilaueensis (strain ATCC BAA-2537 / CCAP 1431/1 / ULC 316 / JS1) TaxID=1183438 RepID=U5QJ39_GLOK1|nr:50S ribosomal protein L18 [Gloeobacter kilaueensis]AGY58873.1 50S ribosomal protein L18 [Gloeobacter kilaueensis JS1]